MKGPRNSRRAGIITALTVALATMLAACNRNTVYSHYCTTGTEGWNRTDTVRFTFEQLPATGTYSRQLGLRTNSRYPFMSVSLVVSMQGRASGFHRTDTVTCQLSDTTGTVLGTGIYHYQYLFTLPEVALQQGDTVAVAVSHIMKRETLPGITDVGLTLASPF